MIKAHDLTIEKASAPSMLKRHAREFTHAFFILDQSILPKPEEWAAYLKNSPAMGLSVCSKNPVPASFKKQLAFQREWSFSDPNFAKEFSAWLKASAPESYESATAMLSEPSLNGLPESKAFHSESDDLSDFLDLGDASAMSIEVDEDSLSMAFDIGESMAAVVDAPEPSLPGFAVSHDDAAENLLSAAASEDAAPASVGALAAAAASDDEAEDLFADSEDAGAEGIDFSVQDDAGILLGDESPVNDSLAVDDLESESEPSLSMASGSEIKDLSADPVLDSLDDLPESAADSQAAQVIKRYALLKEKENREKQKTIDILRSELNKAKSSVQGIQAEKRKLMLKVDDLESDRRAMLEMVDELRHQVATADTETSQKIKDYQSRLENSQFLAKRFEKKLEDFKLRVRLDIQKIRARERELENRLELQKRDAEALLGGKDSRLLNQKRELDKLQFEIEILKERLVEETERAEDRSEKLSRAVQSLKMAQGMLSGIDEEVIATAERATDDEGEAA